MHRLSIARVGVLRVGFPPSVLKQVPHIHPVSA
jgi:hypothetical protein